VLSSPLLSAVSFGSVALPLVCVTGQLDAPRRNRDLLTEEIDLIFPIDSTRDTRATSSVDVPLAFGPGPYVLLRTVQLDWVVSESFVDDLNYKQVL
jgi:hypothetical protein